MRESDFNADTREVIEGLWRRYEPLNPDGGGFLTKAMTTFHQSVWQMYITCLLIDQGFKVEKSAGNAPDVKIRRADGSVLWVEAIAAGAGEGANSTRRVYTSFIDTGRGTTGGTFTVNEEKQILRYQNAIRTKLTHREEFIVRGAIRETDPYVIAVSAADIDDADMDDGLPNIVRALYPIGPIAYTYNVRTDYSDPTAKFDHGGRWTRPITTSVKTPKGKDASTKGFSDSEYAGASAILYSPYAIYNTHPPYGRECITVYNFTACVPIPADTFKFGISFEPTETELVEHEWREPPPNRSNRRAR